MSVSRLLSRVPVGRTLAVVLVLLVALAALDGWAESHRNIVLRVNEICFYLGSPLAVAFIWLLVWHLVASTRRRQFKRLAVHLVNGACRRLRVFHNFRVIFAKEFDRVNILCWPRLTSAPSGDLPLRTTEAQVS